MSVVDGSSEAGTRRRNRRLDLRITQSERELIERAIATTGSGLTEFVVGSAVEAAQRVLADRDRFELTAHAAARHTISFGVQTWPHRLVRVMIAEQVYRALSIEAGSPYHRE